MVSVGAGSLACLYHPRDGDPIRASSRRESSLRRASRFLASGGYRVRIQVLTCKSRLVPFHVSYATHIM